MKAEKRAEHGLSTFGILAMQWATAALVALAAACSSNPSTPGGEGGAGGEGNWGGPASTGTGGTGMGGGGGAGGSMPAKPEQVVAFDPAMGELPEGLAIDGTTAYVGLAVVNKVLKIDLNTKQRSDFGSVPGSLIGVNYTLGLAVDKGIVYAAVGSDDPVQFAPGVYKFPAAGGDATLFGKHLEMSYPRHLGLDGTGAMYISAPRSGALYAMEVGTGMVEKLGIAPEFTGDVMSACASGEPVPSGVNGVAVAGDTVYYTNADRATVYQISDKLTALAGPDCATLGGADGMVVDDVDSSLIIAARKANALTRVKFNGETQTLMKDDLLHEPSAVAIATVGGARYLYWVNSARTTFNSGGIPGLYRMPIGGTM